MRKLAELKKFLEIFDSREAAEAGYKAVVESKLAPEVFVSASINPAKFEE